MRKYRELARRLRWLIAVIASLVVVIWLSRIDHGCNPTGFGKCSFEQPEGTVFRPEKTFWDWLGLLVVPAVLATVGLVYNRTEKRTELHIAEQRAQDALLQSYLDQITALLLHERTPLRKSDPVSEIRGVARVRTLTVLQRLDGTRKRSVLQFLYESHLIKINERFVDLERADLTNADLSEAGLGAADFAGANLSGANFTSADLPFADLTNADLTNADLSGAYLKESHLFSADLSGANLTRADLTGADIQKADLTGADLSGADLSGAHLSGAAVSQEQLATCASLRNATMPDGTKHP